MEEMVEPDRTIMIVSIIGLVVIWGSVAYHKFVQGGRPLRVKDDLPAEKTDEPDMDEAGKPASTAQATPARSSSAPSGGGKKRKKGRKR